MERLWTILLDAEWVADYWANRPDADTLQAEVDEFMRTFEIKEKEVCFLWSLFDGMFI